MPRTPGASAPRRPRSSSWRRRGNSGWYSTCNAGRKRGKSSRPGRDTFLPYRIEYSAAAVTLLRGLTARQRAMVVRAVDEQLTHEPSVETRNRKRMRPNPIAPWELRIGILRAYYDIVETLEPTVFIRAI